MKQILLVCGALVLSSGAHADMRWTTKMTVDTSSLMGQRGEMPGGMAGGAAPAMSFTTAVKAGAQRKETKMQMGPFSMNDVTLTLCEKKEVVQIDDSLKIYTVSPLTSEGAGFVNPLAGLGGALGGMNIPGVPSAPKGAPATGKIVSTIAAEDLGEETIADTPTRHWKITIKNQKSGCAGTGEDTTQMEIWSANVNEPIVCPDIKGSKPVQDMQSALNPNCKITFESKGDGLDVFSKAFGGLVMRMKMLNPKTGKPTMTQEVTMLTRAPQEEALFVVPAGYQKVSAEEFQQKKSQAMMQQLFKGGLPPGFGG